MRCGRQRQVMEKTEPTSLFAYTQPTQMQVEELISGVRATLVIGGLLSTTVLTLLILPLMYHVWERRTELKARPANDSMHFNNKEGEQ